MLHRLMIALGLASALGCGPDPSVLTSTGISGDTTMLPGEDDFFAATAFNALQEELAVGSVVGSSSDPTVAAVSESSGAVLARQPGTATRTRATE